MSRLVVGLTGGIASGKSTVARRFEEAGFTVFDADRLVHDLYRPGAPGSLVVEELFGSEVLDREGGVDRERLGSRVFEDEAARRRLETAVHPLALGLFRDRIRDLEGIVVIEASLLVESGWADAMDVVVTVEARPETRLARAVQRGLSPEEVERRMAAQADEATRRAAADIVIENDDSIGTLERRVGEVVRELRRRRGEGRNRRVRETEEM